MVIAVLVGSTLGSSKWEVIDHSSDSSSAEAVDHVIVVFFYVRHNIFHKV